MSELQHHRLRDFLAGLTRLLVHQPEEASLLREASALLSPLLANDDWLDEAYTRPSAERYQQYLLYADPLDRFSVVSFVWGPGQSTPVHDHRVWGLIGMLRGSEISQSFSLQNGVLQPEGQPVQLHQGQIEAVSPTVGDMHQVRNAHDDRTSISIHVYGANIGAVHRAVYRADGSEKPFISGYNNRYLPNIWDLSYA